MALNSETLAFDRGVRPVMEIVLDKADAKLEDKFESALTTFASIVTCISFEYKTRYAEGVG
jgi:hypothetical protein